MDTEASVNEIAQRLQQRLDRDLARLRDEIGQHPHLVLTSGWTPLHGRGAGYETYKNQGDEWRTAGFAGRMPGSVDARNWPDELPALPLTVGDALKLVERKRTAMAAQIAHDIEESARLLIEPEYLAAVLGRVRSLADGWPWRNTGYRSGWHALAQLIHDPVAGPAMTLPATGYMDAVMWQRWPAEAAPAKVVRWSRDALDELSHGRWGDEDEWSLAHQGYPMGFGWPDDEGEAVHLPAEGRALLYLAEQDVRTGQRRTAMAIDASNAHHAMLTGWRDLPKSKHDKIQATQQDGRVELLAPGGAVQLSLDLPGETALHEQIINALKEWRGYSGLRHWAAMQRLFSVEGERSGFVRWTIDGHMAAMGYSDRKRRDPDTRAAIAREVELLTQMDLAVYDTTGRERARRPVLLVGEKYEKLHDSAWKLDGMQIGINPMLYGGVRNMETGKLGNHYLWVPVELAQLDERSHAPALVLGLLLPIRLKWSLSKGEPSIALKGKNLLQLAGIKYDSHKPGRAWKRLAKNLDKLVELDVLGRWEWYAGEENSLDGRCRIHPPAFALDRLEHGITPLELPQIDKPETGAEMREWRRRNGLKQSEVAAMLGLSQSTISVAERSPDKRLGPTVRARLDKLQKSPSI